MSNNAKTLLLLVVLAVLGIVWFNSSPNDQQMTQITATAECQNVSDTLLTNGKILTVDADDSIVSAIRIRGNIIEAVGDNVGEAGPCTQTIDLAGRTVIPGLIDSHLHWTDRASRPGHHVPEIDNAFSIAEAIEVLKNKAATLPPVSEQLNVDDFVTAIGGYSTGQLAENRLPTLQELDAEITRPVFMSVGFGGSGVTNTAGKTFFEARGEQVSDSGQVGNNGRSVLAADHNSEDVRREILNLMAWSASLGLTLGQDFGGNEMGVYDLLEEMAEEGVSFTRMRVAVGARDTTPNLTVIQKLIDDYFPASDDDMYRIQGLGEFITDTSTMGGSPLPDNYQAAITLIAENGLTYHQHSIPVEQAKLMLTAWEALSEEISITDLRWQLTHVFDMDAEAMDRLQALGGGLAIESHLYSIGGGSLPARGAGGSPGPDARSNAPGGMTGGPPGRGGGGGGMPPGPPYLSAFNHAIPVGAGTDGGNIVTINPWLAFYYMTTGKNAFGNATLPANEKVTVLQALRMYTIGSAWFTFDEEKLGSLELGKLADLVVLSDDILAMEEEGQLDNLRDVKSVLTIVDGDIVYSDGSVVGCSNADTQGIWYRTTATDSCL